MKATEALAIAKEVKMKRLNLEIADFLKEVEKFQNSAVYKDLLDRIARSADAGNMQISMKKYEFSKKTENFDKKAIKKVFDDLGYRLYLTMDDYQIITWEELN